MIFLNTPDIVAKACNPINQEVREFMVISEWIELQDILGYINPIPDRQTDRLAGWQARRQILTTYNPFLIKVQQMLKARIKFMLIHK